MCSSEYFIPFPLYGSGFLRLLILAATSPTSCLFIPLTIIVVLLGVSNSIESGFSKYIEWEKPKFKSKKLSLLESAV